MKKLFLLIPALVLSLITNAAVININTGTTDALRKALNSASDGDIIEMAAGTYVESNENFIAFTGKNIIVRAAEGEDVIIQPQVPITVANGGCAHFQNVKIDASRLHELASWYEHVIYATDAAANNRIILEGCEIYGFALNKSLISCPSASALDELTINNCYFHNINKSCVFIENTSNAIAISITNSTFANITTDAGSYYAGVIDTRATSGSLLVDHCTFYNVEAMNTDYAAIGNYNNTPSGSVVSNCIFAMPSSVDGVRAIRNIEQANNCLTFNYIKDGGGIHSSVNKNNCILNQDPLFADAASGDFSLAGDWTTMSLSPARGAATDGSDLGDPRWAVAETLPSTDFASPYHFKGDKALFSGKIWYDDVNDYIYGDGGSNKVYGTATWKIKALKAGMVEVAVNLNSGNTSGHSISIEVQDADGNSIGVFAEASSTLPGTLSIPAVGDYKVILRNATEWSSAKIDDVTFSYIGGAVQAMPGTTDISEAWFSSNGTRAVGAINYSSVSSGCWAKWNISVANAAWYNVTANIKGQYGHNITVDFFEAGNATPVATATEGKTVYGNDLTSWAASVGLVHLEAGEYEMKFSNSVGDAALISIALTYVGGNVINISPSANTTLPVDDAWFTNGFTRADGQISPGSWKPSAPEPLGFVKWNIATEANATYDLTLNFSSTNAHSMAVNIYEDEDASPVASISESYTSTTGSLTLDGNISLVGGKNYVVVVTNPTSGSEAKVTNIVFAPAASSSAITLPNTLEFNDAILFGTAFVNEDKLYFAEHGKESHIHEDITGAWAVWNVTVETAGTFLFTLNASSTNGQSYKISIMDGETEIDSYLKNPGEGEVEMKHYFYLEPGNYSVKVQNKTSWSHGYLTGLVVTQPDDIIVLSENATDNSAWVDKVNDGNSYKVQIMRSFTGGMYNTICLPIYVSGSEARKVFGEDVVLKVLDDANLDDTESILELNFKTSSDIWQGTPHLIKPSKNIVNPVFENVQFMVSAPSPTTKDQANFVGTFVATNIPAGEENLFLGRNDLLYFNKSAATPVGGFRAWFVLHDIPDGPHFIKGARIVERENTTTGMENVDQLPKANSQKLIENGMLIIIRDGVRYNVMGVRVE